MLRGLHDQRRRGGRQHVSSWPRRRRSSGIFSNPNYTSHYLCAVLLLLPFSRARTTVKAALTVVILAGCVRTGSFSTFVMIAAYVLGRMAVPALQGDLRARARLTAVAAVVAVAAVAAVGLGLHQPTDYGSGLDADRFARRPVEPDRPLVRQRGPDPRLPPRRGTRGPVQPHGPRRHARGRRGLHNDVLDMWVQSGPIALVGALGIVVLIGRRMSDDPRAAGLFAGLVAASLFRQTWNFRHAWLALALAFAFAAWPQPEIRGPTDADRDSSASGSPRRLGATH